MDTPRALAEALLVNLRVGEAASAAVVQLDDHGLFRFVAHDSSPGAEPAQAASERPEVAELPSQPDELTVGREEPVEGGHHPTPPSGVRPASGLPATPEVTTAPLSACRTQPATARSRSGPRSSGPVDSRQPIQSRMRPPGPVPRTSTTVAASVAYA